MLKIPMTVSKLKTLKVPANTFLFSIDVDSLYTNIDTAQRLEAIRLAFQHTPRADRPNEEILQLLQITLTRNDFEFNNKHYLQVCGCAMGRKYSPAYADIYMAEWNQKNYLCCTRDTWMTSSGYGQTQRRLLRSFLAC